MTGILSITETTSSQNVDVETAQNQKIKRRNKVNCHRGGVRIIVVDTIWIIQKRMKSEKFAN